MVFFLNFLIAETRLAEISMQYREVESTSGYPIFGMVLGAIVTVAIALGVNRLSSRGSGPLHCHDAMLDELCRVHRINRQGCKLLRSIASTIELKRPASMLLSEVLFDTALTKARAATPFKPEQEALISMVRRRLFQS